MLAIAAAVVTGGAMIYSSKISASASKEAAAMQAASADKASDKTWKMYQQTRADMLPAIEAGDRMRAEVEGLIAGGFDYQESPMYDYQVEEGMNAFTKAYNAQGLLGSGAFAKDAMKHAVGMAGQDYMNQAQMWLNTEINPRMSMAGSAQVGATNLGGFGERAAGQVGQYGMAGADALASGRVAGANAWTQGIQNVGNVFSKMDWRGFGKDPAAGTNQSTAGAPSPPSPNAWWDGYEWVN